MIGESYLGRCGVLKSTLAEMESMARGLDLGDVISEPIRELGQAIEEPFLLVVTGADGAGKSALVNAFAGEEVATGSSLHDRLVYEYCHGLSAEDSSLGINTVRRTRPAAGLEKLRLVEMPWREDAKSFFAEEILPAADAVLFVFSIANPWAEPGWDFLRTIHFPCADRLICVLQQSDVRTPMEVEVVARHVQQKMREQFGVAGCVQPLSAKLALQARRNSLDDGLLLERSGFNSLERRISEIIAQAEPRLRKLSEKAEKAQRLLDEMASKILARCHTLQRDSQRLSALARSVVGGKADMVQHLTGALLGLARECDRTQMESYRALERNLSAAALLAALFRPVGRGLAEQVGDAPMREAVRREIPHALEGLQAAFREVWEHFHQTLRREISTRLPPAQALPPPTREAREILEEIEREAFVEAVPVAGQKSVFPALGSLAVLLRLLFFVVVVTGGAAIFFAESKPVLAGVVGGVACGVLLAGITIALLKRGKLLAQYRLQLLARREAAIAAAEQQLHAVVEQFYDDMGATFEPLEGFCNARMHFFDPFLQQIGTLGARLETTVKALRAELGE
jgi:GTPase SAR1 family protein